MAKTGRGGNNKTPDIVEDFIEFLYTVKGLTYEDIADHTGVTYRTIATIAKRRGFNGDRGKPQNNDDALTLLDDTLHESFSALNRLIKSDDDSNVHQHAVTNKNLLDSRDRLVQYSPFYALKATFEAFKGLLTWLETAKGIPDEKKKACQEIIATYQIAQHKKSRKFLERMCQ